MSTVFFQVTVSPLHSSSSHDRHQILGQLSTRTTTVLELLYPSFHRIQSWSSLSLSLCLPSPRPTPSRVSSFCTLFQNVNSQSHKTDLGFRLVPIVAKNPVVSLFSRTLFSQTPHFATSAWQSGPVRALHHRHGVCKEKRKRKGGASAGGQEGRRAGIRAANVKG